MAVFEDTYSNLKAQTEALIGYQISSAPELDRFNSLVNLAISRSRKAFDYWQRYLVIAEPRTVSRGFLQTNEDSFHVYGAGSSAANGLYVFESNDGTRSKYYKYDESGDVATVKLEYSGGNWELKTLVAVTLDGEPVTLGGEQVFAADQTLYDITSASTTPPLSGWSSVDGNNPAPLLVDVAEIETALYWQRHDPKIYGNSRTFEFQGSSIGVTPFSNREENTIVYVTYIKRVTDIYGDGSGGTTSDIPGEVFDYVALYCAYMIQASSRQSNASAAYGLALTEVNRSLEDAMYREESQGVAQTIRQNVETRISYSNIL